MQQEKDDEFERTMARRMHGKGWRDDRERGENDMIKFNSKKKKSYKKRNDKDQPYFTGTREKQCMQPEKEALIMDAVVPGRRGPSSCLLAKEQSSHSRIFSIHNQNEGADHCLLYGSDVFLYH